MGHSRSLQMASFESLGTVSYSHSILTMGVSCTVLELKRDIVENRDFFIPRCSQRPCQVVAVRILIYRLVRKN